MSCRVPTPLTWSRVGTRQLEGGPSSTRNSEAIHSPSETYIPPSRNTPIVGRTCPVNVLSVTARRPTRTQSSTLVLRDGNGRRRIEIYSVEGYTFYPELKLLEDFREVRDFKSRLTRYVTLLALKVPNVSTRSSIAVRFGVELSV